TAVIEDIPGNSSIVFNGAISFATLEILWEGVNEDWGNWGYSTFVTLKKSVTPVDFQQKASEFFLNRAIEIGRVEPASNLADDYRLTLVPLTDVTFFDNNKMQYLYIISAIALIIIVLAIINFVNLSTARSALRAKEIGIRKVVGSDRASLIRQYLSEALLYAFLASASAVFIIGMLKPQFFEILGISVSLDYFLEPFTIILFIAGVIIVGITAGIYPALYLSAFAPAQVLKNEITKGEKGRKFRQVLTIFQFIVTIVLIICTLIISSQMDYIKTKDIGVKSKHILYCKPSNKIWAQIDVLREKLLQNPEVTGVAASSGQPGLRYNMGGSTVIDGLEHSFRALAVDPYYVGTVGIDIIQGRNFSKEQESDKFETTIINETAVKEFGIENPIGTEIVLFGYKAKIIGVMRDYHNRSFHHKVGPSILWYLPNNYYRLNISISGNKIPATLEYIEKTYNELSPELPFDYTFVDEATAQLYQQEERARTIIGYFSVFAVFIACLGLFGLMSFTAQRRTKEICIRKVNGASIGNILTLLSKDCIRWIVLANTVAWPLAWYAMDRWLENFAYHIDISLFVFILSGFAALAIALFTVSFQAVKVALANPVDALRNE
ncbi:ABC transporter permease, partial [candidate division KSB1 bacterium]